MSSRVPMGGEMHHIQMGEIAASSIIIDGAFTVLLIIGYIFLEALQRASN